LAVIKKIANMKKLPSIYYYLTILIIITASCETKKGKTEITNQQPNILLIVVDDMGYSDIAPFGGEVSTPTLSKLSEEGIMLTNFHVLPTCSPSRSVLLSGSDNHLAGLGSMEELKTPKQEGKPGYEGYLNNTVAHLPQVLTDAGYLTYMSGKWHLGFEKEHWPSNKGFGETFTLLPGGGSHWADRIPLSPPQIMNYVRNGKLVNELPSDFYSTKNYTDYILEWLERDKNNEKPFFAYVSYTASHDPLHAPKEYIDKYKGKYDQGFEKLRSERFESLKKLGIIPEMTNMPPWPGKSWDDLSPEEKKESARDMEVYAAMIDYMDEQIARILKWLKENNEMDNTIVVFFSDNGANGAMSTAYPGQTEEFLNSIDNSLDNRGLPNSFIEMGPEWATASMSPHRLYKAFTTEGGIISPCIIKLPETINGKKVNKAFTHISDIMPTLLELAGAEHPSIQNDSIPGMIGKSLLPLLNGEKESVHYNEGIGYELHGMRAYIKNDWKIVNLPKPFGKGVWELFNLAKDPSESNDLSNQFPQKRNELISDWEEYSEKVGVIYDPLDFSEILKHE
jgi:arylsulfatase A-like enzyme